MYNFRSILLFFFFPAHLFSIDFIDEHKAANAYQKKDYSRAQKLYESLLVQSPDNLNYMFNLADTFYKQNDFDTAKKYYQKVASLTKQDMQKEQAHFNCGNSLVQKKEESREVQLNNVRDAIKEYEQVLKVNPKNDRAKKNIEKLKKFLEEQKQKEQQKQDQEKKDQEDKQKNQNKDKEKEDSNKDQKQDSKDSDDQKRDKKEQDHDSSDKKEKEEKQDKQKDKQNKSDNEQQKDNEQGKQQPQSAQDEQKSEPKTEDQKKLEALFKDIDEHEKRLNKALVKAKLQYDSVNNNNDQKNW